MAHGLINQWRVAQWRTACAQILRRADDCRRMSDAEILDRARELQWEARCGTPLTSLLVETFALAIESTERELRLRHYPVQVVGALALFAGHIAEMQTGEGKTITAVLPVTLRALTGRGVHVVTANEYLAGRDASSLAPVYQRMGLSVGCIRAQLSDEQRREAYACDITYGTAGEFGFDFLRDRVKAGAEFGDAPRRALFQGEKSPGAVQRGHYCALIDEADSILIDEACTPLILGTEQRQRPSTVALYHWTKQAIGRLDPRVDFVYETKRRQAHLTEQGSRNVLLLAKPVALDAFDAEQLCQHVEKALCAELGYVRNRDYVVVDEKVAIVDEGTGRIMDGRKWQDGLHQAVEAKEFVPVTPATTSAAQVTIQSLFRRYEHLSGMTGTAVAAARELKQIYRCRVATIPTHRPCVRTGRQPRVFATQAAKHRAVLAEVKSLVAQGRAVLIGTPSVSASDALSHLLSAEQVEHVVLNALRHAEEADIVALAGQTGRVTIATNMAGRGTDIKLDPQVAQHGGLHVIATEMHSAARIDRQLIGRAARQGDPGSFQFLLSLEDELLRALPPDERVRISHKFRPGSDGEISARWLRLFRRTQRQLEGLHAKQRRQLLKHERERLKRLRRMGLDPHLELVDV